jgi:dephospho-CoA kinase
MRKFFSVGITGGIASGKSSARKILNEVHNAIVIDADKLGHACYIPGHPCLTQVLDAFGRDNIADPQGGLDRGKLGGIVFSDPLQLQKLNSIVWPHIRIALDEQLEMLKLKAQAATTTIVVVEAAVLIEASWEDLFDEVWVVYVEPDLAIERLMARNHFSRTEAQKRQRSQITNQERLNKCDISIPNNQGLNELTLLLNKEFAKCKVRASGVGLSANEMLSIVDPTTNTVIGAAKRSEVKASRVLCYRATYIFVRQTNSERLYVQRRSDLKDYCPNELDPVFGGCVGEGETYEENAVRELQEELGVEAPLTHLFTFKYAGDASTGPIWGDVWETEIDVPVNALQLQPEEVESVQLMLPEALIQLDDDRTESTAARERVTKDSMVALRMYLERRRREGGGGCVEKKAKY